MHYLIKTKDQYPYNEDILNKFGCYRIFRYLEIHATGDVSICCFSWLPKHCGNVLKDSPDEILNNITRLSLLKDMDQGKFTECNDHCPYLNSILNTSRPSGEVVPLFKLNLFKKNKPFVINFSYDRSCNLECPSCRNDLILHKLGENPVLNEIHKNVARLVEYLLGNGEEIVLSITGSGDSFASPLYWDYLKSLSLSPNKNLSLKLTTNGTLMTIDRLSEIESLWSNIIQVNVSIDAANTDTYKLVRKNGSFEKVSQNLKTLNQLINDGRFKNLTAFQTNFTVQKKNYKEVKDFVVWQLSHNRINNIFFNMVVRWGHLTDLTFESEFDLSYSERNELKEILQDPIFNNHRVMLGNLNTIKNL